jgi:hypothetical protein
MRHPRTVLHFLRFVDSYNELAPRDEEIHLPLIPRKSVVKISTHEWMRATSETRSDVEELRALLHKYSCFCETCDED